MNNLFNCSVAIFEYLGLEVTWLFEEGTMVAVNEGSKVVVATIRGPCRNILLAERTSLNILCRASGIATEARKAVDVAVENNWHGFVAGTRKTTPGFKQVEKYSLLVGLFAFSSHSSFIMFCM